MSRPKIAITLLVLGSLLAAGLSIPLPWHLEATMIIEPLDVRHVYTMTGGELLEVKVKPGDAVSADDVLATLHNPEKEDQRRNLLVQLEVQKQERETRKAVDDFAHASVAEKRVESLEKQLAEVEQQLADLIVTAPITGKVVEPPRTKEPSIEQKRKQLSSWNGTPLEPKNLGAVLEERTHLLSLAPNNRFQAVVLIDQGDRNEMEDEGISLSQRLEETQQAQRVIELKFEHLPAKTYQGYVKEFSKNPLDYVPEMLSSKHGGELPTVTDNQGREKLVSPVYQATIDLGEDVEMLRSGMRGRARFLVDERTTWQWIWRYIRRTFHFRL